MDLDPDPDSWICILDLRLWISPNLVPDPALNPVLFVSDFQDANKKYFFFFLICFAYYFLWLHCIRQIKSHEATKHHNSRFLLVFLLADGRIRIQSGLYKIIMDPDRRSSKNIRILIRGSGAL
jgi:hypothetical protein